MAVILWCFVVVLSAAERPLGDSQQQWICSVTCFAGKPGIEFTGLQYNYTESLRRTQRIKKSLVCGEYCSCIYESHNQLDNCVAQPEKELRAGSVRTAGLRGSHSRRAYSLILVAIDDSTTIISALPKSPGQGVKGGFTDSGRGTYVQTRR